MTDKEKIITNEIDVSKCEYVCNTAFGKIGCKQPLMKYIHCSENSNCHYKQLQRKTQLSIEQSKELIRLRQELKESTVKNKNLKQECEELEKLVQQAQEAPICFQCEQEPCIRQERDRYRKALEEIEEMIKISTKDFNHIDWEAKASHALTAIDKIFDIINKAKGEECN